MNIPPTSRQFQLEVNQLIEERRAIQAEAAKLELAKQKLQADKNELRNETQKYCNTILSGLNNYQSDLTQKKFCLNFLTPSKKAQLNQEIELLMSNLDSKKKFVNPDTEFEKLEKIEEIFKILFNDINSKFCSTIQTTLGEYVDYLTAKQSSLNTLSSDKKTRLQEKFSKLINKLNSTKASINSNTNPEALNRTLIKYKQKISELNTQVREISQV